VANRGGEHGKPLKQGGMIDMVKTPTDLNVARKPRRSFGLIKKQ